MLNGLAIDDRGAERALEGERELIGADLARRVRRLRVQRVLLVDRNRLRGSVDLARGGVDDAGWLLAACGFEDVQRAFDVGGHELPGMPVGVGNRDQRAQMEDDLAPGHRAGHGFRIGEVAPEDLDFLCDIRLRALEPSVVATGVVADECAHARAGPGESLGQMAADEAAGPGDEHGTPRPGLRVHLRALRGHRAGNLLRMRLLVCVPWFAPARAFGGTVTAAVATVKGALEAGHEVTVATTDALDLESRVPAYAPAEPAGARVIRFRNVSQRLAATNAPLPRGLRRWLREHVDEFDVVLLLDVYSAVSVLAARAAGREGVPYVLEALGTLPTAPERGRPAAKRAFLALWGRRTVREAALCLYLSENEREEYLAQGADPARLLPMPPPLDLPEPPQIPRARPRPSSTSGSCTRSSGSACCSRRSRGCGRRCPRLGSR